MNCKYFQILVIVLILITGCKKATQRNSTVSEVGVTEKIQKREKLQLKKFIGRSELSLNSQNEKLVWGEFYSPRTDSLIIFKFIPKNSRAIDKVKKMNSFFGDEFKKKQNLILEDLEIFNVSGYTIDYRYVLEQKDAGGDNVFKIKEPFKAQSFIYKNDYIILNNNKTYQKFEIIYK